MINFIKRLVILALMLTPVGFSLFGETDGGCCIAQIRIAYLSYNNVLKTMPEYEQSQAELEKLRAQYDEETKRAEEEFNAKYEAFLDNLSTLAPTIRRKRQTELQQLLESNVRFREEARRLLQQAEEDAMASLQRKLDTQIRIIALNAGYGIVINTDNNSCPFIDATLATDITELVKVAVAR